MANVAKGVSLALCCVRICFASSYSCCPVDLGEAICHAVDCLWREPWVPVEAMDSLWPRAVKEFCQSPMQAWKWICPQPSFQMRTQPSNTLNLGDPEPRTR